MITDLIYDVGMHNGDDTAFYLHKGYRVVAIEADPVLADKARTKFASAIAAGRLVLLACGVAPQDGHATFWICDDINEYSSFDPRAGKRTGKYHAIDIPCRTFRSILQEYGVPFYLKVDIEKYDTLCVEALDPQDRPAYVSLEMTDLVGLNILIEKGYGGLKCIGQRYHRQIRFDLHPEQAASPPPAAAEADWQFLPTDPGLQNWFHKPGPDGWAFRLGSSGPFGEDTDGIWQTWEEMTFSYLAQRLGHIPAAKRTMNDWFDLHARIQPPDTPTPEFDPAAKVLQIMNELAATLHRPVQMWLFGAGRHTTRLLEQKARWEQAGHRIVGLLDDDARFVQNPVHLGLLVWSRQAAAALLAQGQTPDGIILSSDTFEDHFWQLTAPLRAQGVSVFRLYGS